jgi:hypothetical protein
MGAEYVDTKFVPQSFFAEHRLNVKEYADKPNPLQFVYEKYAERFPNIVKGIEDLVEDIMHKNAYDTVVTSAGFLHLVHVVARHKVDSLDPRPEYFYDSPYQWRAYARPFISSMSEARSAKFQPNPEAIAKKLEIFEKCYPSERYMITADRHLYYRYPEIVAWNR